jgi:hypothetical protein
MTTKRDLGSTGTEKHENTNYEVSKKTMKKYS